MLILYVSFSETILMEQFHVFLYISLMLLYFVFQVMVIKCYFQASMPRLFKAFQRNLQNGEGNAIPTSALKL